MAARDPVGGRPLYQGISEGISVVSTVPALLEALSIPWEPVRPGLLVVLRGGAFGRAGVRPAGPAQDLRRGAWARPRARVGELLKESVKLRLRGAKSVGVAFSEGWTAPRRPPPAQGSQGPARVGLHRRVQGRRGCRCRGGGMVSPGAARRQGEQGRPGQGPGAGSPLERIFPDG